MAGCPVQPSFVPVLRRVINLRAIMTEHDSIKADNVVAIIDRKDILR